MTGNARIAFLLAFFMAVSLASCSGGQQNTTPSQQTSAPAQGTFIYVGEIAASPDAVFPTNDMDALTSYQLQPDGSLQRLGAFQRSDLPGAIMQFAAAGQWVFTCDGSANCNEFTPDSTGNLVRGKNISSVQQIAAIDPTGTWLIAATVQGEQAFRIQPDGSLTPGPTTPISLPLPPTPDPAVDFFIMTFDPTGKFAFAVDEITNVAGVYRFDVGSGTFTSVGTLPPEIGSLGFAFLGFTSDGAHALGFSQLTNELYVFSWDANAGVLTVLSHGVFTLNDGTKLQPVYMAAADNFIFVPQVSQSLVLRFDPASATLSDTGLRFASNDVDNGPIHADSKSHTLVEAAFDANLVGTWKYDPATGIVTSVPGSPYPAALDPEILGVLGH